MNSVLFSLVVRFDAGSAQGDQHIGTRSIYLAVTVPGRKVRCRGVLDVVALVR